MSQSSVKVFKTNLRKLRWFHWLLSVQVTAGLLLSLYKLSAMSIDSSSRNDLRLILVCNAVMLFAWLRWVLPMFVGHTVARMNSTSILEMNTAFFMTEYAVPFSNVERVLRRSEYCVELKLKAPTRALFSFLFFRRHSMQDQFPLIADVHELDSLCKTLEEGGVKISANSIPDDDPTALYTMVSLILIGPFLITWLYGVLLA